MKSPGSAKRVECPRCNRPLEIKAVQGVVIDRCARCCGLWFDRGELKRIEKAGGADMVRLLSLTSLRDDEGEEEGEGLPENPAWNDLASDAEDATINCPRCEGVMDRVPDPAARDVVIDVCGKCGGGWYDGGEIDAHERALRDEGVFGALRRILGL